jgi:threonine/homoserine/homoserine lactone efflux protein
MTIAASLITFLIAAGLLTITPGLDTALVLRTSTLDGARRAALAGAGVVTGCLLWGAAVALGVAALLTASEAAFTLLKWVGAAYLLWVGVKLLLKPRGGFDATGVGSAVSAGDGARWYRRGLLTNLLNPKVGVFYVSFLPQFVPAGVSAGPYIFLLAILHGLLGLAWFAALILATRPLNRALKRPAIVRSMDRLTGCVFVAFGVKLALTRR